MKSSPLEERIWQYISNKGCWEWTGTTSRGYGYIRDNHGKNRPAHRIVYEMLVGEIPPDQEIDHLCRNRACVNPTHLEPVTHRINVLRGESPVAIAHRMDTCKRGHSNFRTRPNGLRYCRTCETDRMRAKYYAIGADEEE